MFRKYSRNKIRKPPEVKRSVSLDDGTAEGFDGYLKKLQDAHEDVLGRQDSALVIKRISGIL